MSMRWGSELPRQRYRSSKEAQVSPLGAWYRRHLAKRPFLFFGLPFVSLVVAGSFALTPVTALRYERYDLKARQLSQEEAMQIGKDKKPFNIQEEYFVSRLADWLKAELY